MSFEFFMFFLFSLITVFWATKGKLRKMGIYFVIIVYLVTYVDYLWRVNISAQYLLVVNSCLSYIELGRYKSAIFKSEGVDYKYKLNYPFDFSLSDKSVGHCFEIQYYNHLGSRYLYSVDLKQGG